MQLPYFGCLLWSMANLCTVKSEFLKITIILAVKVKIMSIIIPIIKIIIVITNIIIITHKLLQL